MSVCAANRMRVGTQGHEGCMDAWMHGCIDTWTHGCMGVWGAWGQERMCV
jgi:hypothetical protein